MTPDEIRRLYSIRHTLPAFQRQMIERAYSELEGTASVSWDTPDIDAADSAAVEIKADPSLAVPLTDPQPERPEVIDLTADADMRPDTSRLPPINTAPQQRPGAIDLTAGEADPSPGGRPPLTSWPTDAETIRRLRQQDSDAPARPEREDWVARRTAELVRMGRPLTYRDAATSPEVARARAEAEYDDPNGWQRNPNSTESMSPQVRAAVRRQIDIEAQQRNADIRASLGGGEQQFNARKFREERAAAEAAAQANARRKWDEWTTGGSLERMAEYAPEEYNQRWEAAAEGRRKQNAEERARRYTTNPQTGEVVRNEEYIAKQRQADRDRLRRTDPQANRALVRQLEEMGVDTAQFGDWRSPSFNREAALDAKSRVMARGIPSPSQEADGESGKIAMSGPGVQNPGLGGRYGAVQRRAMLRQNPWEYMGRGDINDEQRRTAAFLLSNGRGATANDVAALSAKALLEGIERGAERGMRIGNMDAKTEIAAGQTRQQILQNAQAAANEFFRDRAERDGIIGSRGLSEESYGDLVSMLTAITGSPAMAEGIARRYRRLGGRAERTAPPST